MGFPHPTTCWHTRSNCGSLARMPVEDKMDKMRDCNNSATSKRHAAPYCVWIRGRESAGARLVAVWIDPSMQSFEDACRIAGPESVARAEVAVTQPAEEHLEEQSDGTGPSSTGPNEPPPVTAAIIYAL